MQNVTYFLSIVWSNVEGVKCQYVESDIFSYAKREECLYVVGLGYLGIYGERWSNIDWVVVPWGLSELK